VTALMPVSPVSWSALRSALPRLLLLLLLEGGL
jgi:hypothetical protein